MSAPVNTSTTSEGLPAGAHSHGGPVPTGSPAERFTSTDPEAFGKPSGREEDWRFTPMRRVRGLLNGEPSDARLSADTDLPDGVELTTVEADDPLLKGLPEPADYLAALTRQRADGATVVRVAAEAQLDRPVRLRLTGTGSDDVVWAQTVIEVGAFSWKAASAAVTSRMPRSVLMPRVLPLGWTRVANVMPLRSSCGRPATGCSRPSSTPRSSASHSPTPPTARLSLNTTTSPAGRRSSTASPRRPRPAAI